MSYEYEDWDEEPTQEELEKYEGEESTEVKTTPEKLKIEFDTENFASGIVCAVVSEVKKNLYTEIVTHIKTEIVENMKEKIMLKSGEIIKEIIDDYVKNEKITIGGNSFWDDEPLQEYSMQEYAKKCIADAIKKGKFTVCNGYEKDRYSKSGYKAKQTTYEFDAYIRSELAIGNDIKQYIDAQIMEIKDSVNKGVKDMFDASTKQMLSDSVLKVLMSNETYQKIQSNIACIADKSVE